MRRFRLSQLHKLGFPRLTGNRPALSGEKEPGLAPGAMVHVGEKRVDRTTFEIIQWDAGKVDRHAASSAEEAKQFVDGSRVTWMRVTGLHEVEKISGLKSVFGIHPLLLEDVLNTASRAKIEESDDSLFVILKLIGEDPESNRVDVQQFAALLLPNLVVTFQEAEASLFEPLEQRIDHGRGRIRKAGADYLLWAILDVIVDNYFVVQDSIDEKIGQLDERLQDDAASVDAAVLYATKKEITELHRLVRPVREIIFHFQRSESILLTEQSEPFYRDLYDHAIHVIEATEDLRELGSSLRDFYMAAVGHRMNEVMKILTIFATLFMPITFLAGIYGMNFEHMPELGWPWAYGAIWGLFVLITVAMIVYFKRKRWW